MLKAAAAEQAKLQIAEWEEEQRVELVRAFFNAAWEGLFRWGVRMGCANGLSVAGTSWVRTFCRSFDALVVVTRQILAQYHEL